MFRIVALPAPSDREKTQMFAQRYIELTGHSPSMEELQEMDDHHATTIHVIQRHSSRSPYARSTFLKRKNFRRILRKTLALDWPLAHLNR